MTVFIATLLIIILLGLIGYRLDVVIAVLKEIKALIKEGLE